LAAKLDALVAARWPAANPRPASFPGGAALHTDREAWVLVEDRPGRALGPALAWAHRRGGLQLHLVVDEPVQAGGLARRAQLFVDPPSIWTVDDRVLRQTDPDPVADPVVPSAVAQQAADQLRAHGLEVVVDHGEVVGELLGLEVARVVVGDDGQARVEAGVGRHDRDAARQLHGERPPEAALAQVVETVAAHRRPGAEPHPLNRLAAERWLRACLVADPGLVGAHELFPVEGVDARSSVKDTVPAAAVGEDAAGDPLVVVASTGIDLDLVPTAADVRLAFAPDARLILAVPARDDHPITRALAGALRAPAEVVAIEGDWRAGAPEGHE
jgi:hypothetical protein